MKCPEGPKCGRMHVGTNFRKFLANWLPFGASISGGRHREGGEGQDAGELYLMQSFLRLLVCFQLFHVADIEKAEKDKMRENKFWENVDKCEAVDSQIRAIF